jgi:polysaccharide biosynthesis/export protein
MDDARRLKFRTWRFGTALSLFCLMLTPIISAARRFGAPAVQEPLISAQDYRIGAKDLLEIKVFELPELNQTVRVSEDGSITLTLLGRVEAAGFTAQELEKRLAALLQEQFTTGGAHVTVFIKEYQKITIIGAVVKPGLYELLGPMTLLQAIAQAGGFTAQAMNEIFVYREEEDGQQTRLVIKTDDLMVSGNQEFNIVLKPKDVVTIPIDQILNVFIYGEVHRPGAIPFLSSKKVTLLQAIAQAGGTTEWAKKSRVMIKRKDKKTGKEVKIPVNLKNMISGKVADIVLEEGDVVIVP